MSDGAMASVRPDGDMGRPVGRNELAEGLMLVRASTLKVVRLQLAMERRDRRTALATVDDLVMLDGQIRDFLEAMPAEGKPGVMQRELEAQLGALAREKLTLAAGMSGRAVGERPWIEPPRPIRPAGATQILPEPATDETGEGAVRKIAPSWLGAPEDVRQESEPTSGGRVYRLVALLLLAMALIAAAVSQIPAGMGIVRLVG
ncbi:hypothetical protein [Sphingosinicella rhizophila]|uniref:Uncharacterized protein n=1 Tax=Sphingosinicella rhizophila TaxID=3050082 RepID=A0ABU3Q9V0_9SPHN|nr:hypothetical protein [Sphingosinicella sp. GR2756]MDT9600151.1 hypothetical protein [Sphingosinicella sp. GR2756]